MLGTTKEIDREDPRILFHAGAQCIPHQCRCTLAPRSPICAHSCCRHRDHYRHHLPYLETQEG